MELGTEKCTMLIMKSRKRERIKVPDQGRIRTLGEKENYNSL